MNKETFLGDNVLPRMIWIIIGFIVSLAVIPFGPKDSFWVLLDLIPLGIGGLTWGLLFHFHIKRQNSSEVFGEIPEGRRKTTNEGLNLLRR